MAVEQWRPPGVYVIYRDERRIAVATLVWVLRPDGPGAPTRAWSLALRPGDGRGDAWTVQDGPAFEHDATGRRAGLAPWGVTAGGSAWAEERGSLAETTARLPLSLALVAQAMGPRLLELLDAGAGPFVDEG
jgi:hypothetical protein